jgi:hypothetical protein
MYSYRLDKYPARLAILFAVILMAPISNRSSALISAIYQENREPDDWRVEKFFEHIAWQPDGDLIAAGEGEIYGCIQQKWWTRAMWLCRGLHLESSWSPDGLSTL